MPVSVSAALSPARCQLGAGCDINCVKERDWDNMMRFTDYSTPTGFVTAYWNPPTLNGVLMKPRSAISGKR
ncbi:YjbH domain-containing protein [Escherichia coli]